VAALTSSPHLSELRSLTMREVVEGEGEPEELYPKLDPRIVKLLRQRFGNDP
jgi:hypothetical protein